MSRTRPRRWRWVLAAVILALIGLYFAVRVADTDIPTMRFKYMSDASRFMTVEPGMLIHYRDEGPADALPVVLLHGSNASLQTWEPWVSRLKGRYRVITFDFPGHGLTGPWPRNRVFTSGSPGSTRYQGPRYTTDDFAQVVTDVLTRLRLDKVVIGGNSMGGAVAAAWAAAHPERIAGLVLIDSSGAPYRNPSDADLPIGFRIARTPVIRNLVESITPRSIIQQSLEQTVADPRIVTPAMVDRYWELLRYPGNRAATIDRFSSPYVPLDAAALARVQAPVVIVWGRRDRLIPVDNADWFAKTLPQAKVAVLDNIGHVPMEEAPDLSLAPVLPMLAAAAQAGSPALPVAK